ncbi:MAG: acyl-CoA thioesterase [Nitrospirae bacterium]|nr:acyl-CoA thioesterase [Nitrospirota bacterium]
MNKMRRNKKFYFKRAKESPEPIVIEIKRRVHFSEVDIMGIVWFGRYPAFFEEGAEELGRYCGLSYKDFYKARLRAPIVELHIDYLKPLCLNDEFTIRTALTWDEGARLNTEYYLLKHDNSVATSGYTVQLLTDVDSGEVCITSPTLLERCRKRWRAGEFHIKRR